jgi:hypothetical protein
MGDTDRERTLPVTEQSGGGQDHRATRAERHADRNDRADERSATSRTLHTTMNRRPQLELVAPGASPEEAAAIVAALERFMRETAPVIVAADPTPNPWFRAGLLESLEREPPQHW